MKRPDVLAAYQDYSARTSENVRRLSFAALGVIWVFRPPSNSTLPRTLLLAGAFAVGALALDFLQSLYATVAWGVFHRRKERAGIDNETEFKAPRQMNWPTNGFFTAKVLMLGGAYMLLLRYLVMALG